MAAGLGGGFWGVIFDADVCVSYVLDFAGVAVGAFRREGKRKGRLRNDCLCSIRIEECRLFEGDLDGMCSPEMVGAMRRYYGHVGRTEDELPLRCDLMVILYLSAFQHEFGPEPARQLGFDLFTKEEISFANGKCNLQRGLLSEVENTIQSAAIDNLVWLQGRFEARKDTLNELEQSTLVEIACVVPLFENQ